MECLGEGKERIIAKASSLIPDVPAQSQTEILVHIVSSRKIPGKVLVRLHVEQLWLH